MTIILRILSALEQRTVSLQDVDRLVYESKDNEEFDSGLARLGVDLEEYAKRCALLGIGKDEAEANEELVSKYFFQTVVNTVQNALEISADIIIGNTAILDEIIGEIAGELGSFSYGLKISKHIKNTANHKIRNSERKYKKAYENREVNPDTILAEVDDLVVEITDGMKSIDNVKGVELYSILKDLHDTNKMYTFNPQNAPSVYYSIMLSFQRMLFSLKIPEMAKSLEGVVDVYIPSYADAKLKKLDVLMELVLPNFLLPGLNHDNMGALAHTALQLVFDITITHTAAIFLINTTGSPNGGNLNSPFVFTTPYAVQNFDTVMKAFLALSKLNKYLTDAGVSVFKIEQSLFQSATCKPQEKFRTLGEVVRYSHTFAEIRDKYKISGRESGILAFTGRAPHYVNTNDPAITALENAEKFEVFEDLYIAVDGIFEQGDSHDDFNIISLPDTGHSVNIWHMVRAMYFGVNPLVAVVGPLDERLPSGTNTYIDDEIIVDSFLIEEYLAGIFSPYFRKVYKYGFDFKEIPLLTAAVSNTSMGEVFQDLNRHGIEKEVDLLIATFSIARELQELRAQFLDLYSKPTNISKTEYVGMFFDSEIFKGVIKDISYKEAFGTREELKKVTIFVAYELLKDYCPWITVDIVETFIYEEPKSSFYANFKVGKILALFTQITKNMASAKAHYFNARESTAKIFLNDSELSAVLASIDQANQNPLFETYIGDAATNDLGYLVTSFGKPFSVKHKDNILGALHSSGYYIYVDKTIEEWRPI